MDSALAARGWVTVSRAEAAEILAEGGLRGALDVLKGEPACYLHIHPEDPTKLRAFVLYGGPLTPTGDPRRPVTASPVA